MKPIVPGYYHFVAFVEASNLFFNAIFLGPIPA